VQKEVSRGDSAVHHEGEIRRYERDALAPAAAPLKALRSLGVAEVELRVTLSYFVEPSPARRGWGQRHRYASHGLRFDLQTADENKKQFLTRINKAAREEGEQPDSKSDSGDWVLGKNLDA
jgi:hypothetical protein